MGDNTPLDDNVINVNEEARFWALDPNGDWVEIEANSSGSLQVSASGGVVEEHTGNGQDIQAATASHQFDVESSMESVVVGVDDADGAFHVEVQHMDGNGTELVTRDNNNTSRFAGDANTDVFIEVQLASAEVRVLVVDDSGAANTVDYVIRAS
jgi:hypothetical protein